jgi:hypothetical protein
MRFGLLSTHLISFVRLSQPRHLHFASSVLLAKKYVFLQILSLKTCKYHYLIFRRSQAKMPKDIEDVYQKVSQLEHVLLRPDTYVGSVEYIEKTVSLLFDIFCNVLDL